MGTVLSLEWNGLKQELWSEHLDFIAMEHRDAGNAAVISPVARDKKELLSELGRRCDIFLDYVALCTSVHVQPKNLMR